jgi:two-component system, OmpR family, response regulator
MITRNNPTPADSSDILPRKTILVVDDDEAVRKGLRGVLVSEGYKVVAARNGHEALQVFRVRPCDLALLDMNMPVRNGWGTIADLRALSPQLPTIIITARSDQRNVAREAGVELMEKPLDLPLLLHWISVLLNKPADGIPTFSAALLRL